MDDQRGLSDHTHPHITYDYFSLPEQPHNDALTRAVARCYQLVYGNDPSWQEGKWCIPCTAAARSRGERREIKWSFDMAPVHCPHCHEALVDRWPIDGIITDMNMELARPGAVYVIARDSEVIVGGCMGLLLTPAELEHHVELDGLARSLQLSIGAVTHVTYQDEIFVLPAYQGQRIGRGLFDARFAYFHAMPQPPSHFAFRTKKNPPSTSFLWFTQPHWGYREVAWYHDEDDRVILAAPTDKLPVDRTKLPPVPVNYVASRARSLERATR
jgi:GNAT superfamily N-acetyltransferase